MEARKPDIKWSVDCGHQDNCYSKNHKWNRQKQENVGGGNNKIGVMKRDVYAIRCEK